MQAVFSWENKLGLSGHHVEKGFSSVGGCQGIDGALPALWVTGHQNLPGPRGPHHERWPSVAAVTGGGITGAAQTRKAQVHVRLKPLGQNPSRYKDGAWSRAGVRLHLPFSADLSNE